MQKFTKKFGFFTALAMVIGIVIGSGVFYKAQQILLTVDGNMPLGIIAWLIGGAIMICCSATFAVMAAMFEGIGGASDYAELCCSEKYAFYFSWFLATILYPSLASVLAWLSGRYAGALFGFEGDSGEVMLLSGAFLIFSYVLNVISPKVAGKFQVSATVVKLIPLVLMAIVGCLRAAADFGGVPFAEVGEGAGNFPLFGAIVATAFAYEGWIVATSINTELTEGKQNMPRALIIGGAVIVSIYTLYYVGLTGAISVNELMEKGASAAFISLFGERFGFLLNVFVCVSCLGTLNGLTMATVRGFYVCGSRLKSSMRYPLTEIDRHTDTPSYSAALGLLASAIWLVYFYGANVGEGWFGAFNFDSSELPVITVYGLYIPIFIGFIRRYGRGDLKRKIILPTASLFCSVFIIGATVYAHGISPYLAAKAEGYFSLPVLFYLIVFAVIMLFGVLLRRIDSKKSKEEQGVKTGGED